MVAALDPSAFVVPATRLPATLELTLVTVVVAGVVGIPLGVVAALRRNSWLGHGLRVVTIALGDADRATLARIASSPDDYYETADPAALPDTFYEGSGKPVPIRGAAGVFLSITGSGHDAAGNNLYAESLVAVLSGHVAAHGTLGKERWLFAGDGDNPPHQNTARPASCRERDEHRRMRRGG